MSKMTHRGLAIIAGLVCLLLPVTAFAQVAGATANSFDLQSTLALAAALALGLAVIGGALGQGKAAAAALEGISRNPGAQSKIMTPMLIALALIESLVLLAFVIAFLMFLKIS